MNLKTLEPYEVALLNKNFLMRQKIVFECKREGVILKNRLDFVADQLNIRVETLLIIIDSFIVKIDKY